MASNQCLIGIVILTDVRQASRQELHDMPVEGIVTTESLITVDSDHTIKVMQQSGAIPNLTGVAPWPTSYGLCVTEHGVTRGANR